MVVTISSVEETQNGSENGQRMVLHLRAPVKLVQGLVRVRLDEPCMDAILRVMSVYCASIPPQFHAKREAIEALLLRLLRSRMRLVRSEFLRLKLEYASEEERLDYRMKAKTAAYVQLYLMPEEVMFMKEGLELLGSRLERDLNSIEDGLLHRFASLGQAIQAGKNPHSELVRALNRRRGMKRKESETGRGAARTSTPGTMRLRFREWTVRAAIFGIVSYMRYVGSSHEWRRAYRLLQRMIRLHRDVIASQVKHGKPGRYLINGEPVKAGLGIEPNKRAYITPRLGIHDLQVMREGLELRSGELEKAAGDSLSPRYRLNPTEQVLLLKSKRLYDAAFGVGDRRVRWRREDWRRSRVRRLGGSYW